MLVKMSLKVTQDTFNRAVFENMEIFSLSLEESIQETLKQFRSQGADIFGIITDPTAISSGDPIKDIKEKLASSNDESTKRILIEELINLLKKDDAYKISCGINGIYDVCLDILVSSNSSVEIKLFVMDFLLSLFDGYPDLLDERGCQHFVGLLDGGDTELQRYALKLVQVTSIKHEINRQMYIHNNVTEKFLKLVTHEYDDDLLKLSAMAVYALTLDDDVRTATPKCYTHACGFADVLLKPFCKLLKVKKDPVTLRHIVKALTAIVVNYDYCAVVEAEGGVPAIMFIIERNRANEALVTQCFKFLTCLAGNDVVKDKLMKFDIAQEIHNSLTQSIHKKKNVNASLTLISKISLRSPEYGKLFFKLDFPHLIVQALKIHPDDYVIQAAGCWCIRNMSSRNPEYHTQFLTLGVEEILNQILKSNKCCSYDAKIALCELGCNVSAREPWTGIEGDKLAQNS